MDEMDIKKYNDIKKIIDTYKQIVPEIKIVFQSNENEKNNSFASYQFPTDKYNEDVYNILKKFAELDFEINKRNNNKVGTVTNFRVYDAINNTAIGLYNYHHSLEFLDSMIDKQMTL